MSYRLATMLVAALVTAACGSPAPDRAPPPAAADGPGAEPAAEATVQWADKPNADAPADPGTGMPAEFAPQAPVDSRQPATARESLTPPSGPTAVPDQPAAAQDDEGAAVLRRAAAAYEGMRSLQADFVMNFDNPLLRQTTTSRGTIYQRQPDRIALRFSDPDGDVILGDGRYFWVYYPSVNAQQVIRSPAAAAGESGVNLQAQFVGDPVERFRHELHGTEAVEGRPAHIVNLVPRQRAEYRSLKAWIDARDGLVRRFELTEHNGNVRRFDLHNLRVNPTIAESVFQFTPPPGARIVEAG